MRPQGRSALEALGLAGHEAVLIGRAAGTAPASISLAAVTTALRSYER